MVFRPDGHTFSSVIYLGSVFCVSVAFSIHIGVPFENSLENLFFFSCLLLVLVSCPISHFQFCIEFRKSRNSKYLRTNFSGNCFWPSAMCLFVKVSSSFLCSEREPFIPGFVDVKKFPVPCHFVIPATMKAKFLPGVSAIDCSSGSFGLGASLHSL